MTKNEIKLAKAEYKRQKRMERIEKENRDFTGPLYEMYYKCFWTLIFIVIALIIIVLGFSGGYIEDALYGSNSAAQYLKQSGYTNLKLTGVDHMFVYYGGCGGDDVVEYTFKATASNHQRVSVHVCKPFLFGGAQIRQ